MRKQDESSTYEEWLKVPEHQIGEILSGELVISSLWSGWAHRAVHRGILWELFYPMNLAKSSQGASLEWQLFPRIDVRLHKDILVPDWAGWKKSSFSHHFSETGIAIAPQWVCEILSAESEKLDREQKLPIYAREEVDYAWLIQPATKTLEVYVRNRHQWEQIGSFFENEKVCVAPFDKIEFNLGSLWLSDG